MEFDVRVSAVRPENSEGSRPIVWFNLGQPPPLAVRLDKALPFQQAFLLVNGEM
ncbi:MAG: hypothetical protein L3J28_13095 [Candidatus Polarisedimenticolaceae bacterium]|nr:hypothetical protein [Candidatus Polarisedimenticolaceae bacterium]